MQLTPILSADMDMVFGGFSKRMLLNLFDKSLFKMQILHTGCLPGAEYFWGKISTKMVAPFQRKYIT